MEKFLPNVGDRLYLRQYTGSHYIDLIKKPYTVISVDKNEVIVQEAKCIFPIFHYDPKTMSDYYKQFDGRRVCFYDTLAESIEPCLEGNWERLTWHSKRGAWGTQGRDCDYPKYAVFGKYDYFPYLD